MIQDTYYSRKFKKIEEDIKELENEDVKSALKLILKISNLLFRNLFVIGGVLFIMLFFVAKQIDLL